MDATAGDWQWPGLADQVLGLERAGRVTRTFRRLDPERQAAVIRAILEEAADQGPAGAGIKAVALRAGVSVGSLYQYFGSRDGMIDFAVELCRTYMEGVLEASRPFLVDLPLREGLAAYVLGGVDWAASQIAATRLFARAAYRGDADLSERLVRPVGAAMRAVVRAMLEAGVTRGEVRADADLDAAAGTVHALAVALGDGRLMPFLDAYFQLTPPGIPQERALAAAVDLVARGLAPDDPGPALPRRG